MSLRWTDEDAQLLRRLREKSGADRANFARRCTISVAQLVELEEGGQGRFYNDRIRAYTGHTLLKKLGYVAAPVATPVEAPPVAAPAVEPATQTLAVPALAGDTADLPEPPAPVAAPAPVVAAVPPPPAAPTPRPMAPAPAPAADPVPARGRSNGLAWGVGLLALAAGVGLFMTRGPGSATAPKLVVTAVDVPAPAAPAASASTGEPAAEATTPPASASAPLAAPASAPAPAPAVAAAPAAPAAAGGARCDPVPREGVVQYTPPSALRPGNYVHLEAPRELPVCVLDSRRQATAAMVKPGEGLSVYGEPPFTVQTAHWSELRVFFQGIRVALDSPASPAAVVLNPR